MDEQLCQVLLDDVVFSYPDWLNGDPPCVVIISLSLDDSRMGGGGGGGVTREERIPRRQ